jgi:adenylosuccinate synthase
LNRRLCATHPFLSHLALWSLVKQKYLKRIEELTGIPISWVGVGAGRLEMATQGFKAK